MHKKITIIFMMILCLFGVSLKQHTYAIEEEAVVENQDGEFRAVWITHLIQSMPKYTTEEAFKNRAYEMFDVLEHYNYNAMIVHFRTHNNALYKSELNPRASWFETVDFDQFDPMLWLIEEAHSRGIEFHAWLNPYRLGGNTVGLPQAANPASNPENILTNPTSKASILNPGLPIVREHINNTIEEILERYPVDAIHFDDYFYTNLGANGALTGSNTIIKEPDQSTFEKYAGKYNTSSASDKAEWRREQVNLLVKGVRETIDEFNRTSDRYVQFGISPTGIYRNGNGIVTYDEDGMPITTGSNTRGQEHYNSYLFSDSLNWVKQGWLDYIIPQSYWATNHSTAAYSNVIGWWDKVVKHLDVNLYSGIGIYRADETTNPSEAWVSDVFELSKQFMIMNTLENVKGHSVYRLEELEDGYNNKTSMGAQQIKNAAKTYLTTIVPLAPLKSVDAITLPKVENAEIKNNVLTFDPIKEAKFYYIYSSANELTFNNEEIIAVIGNQDLDKIEFIIENFSEDINYGIRALSSSNHMGEKTLDIPIVEEGNNPDNGNNNPDDGNNNPDDGNNNPDDGNNNPDDGNSDLDKDQNNNSTTLIITITASILALISIVTVFIKLKKK